MFKTFEDWRKIGCYILLLYKGLKKSVIGNRQKDRQTTIIIPHACAYAKRGLKLIISLCLCFRISFS